MTQKTIKIDTVECSNNNPFTLFGGLNVLENRDITLKTAETFTTITQSLNIPYVFKASFDKANRSSINSFRGIGIDEGLKLLQEVKSTFNIPIITDVHEPGQAAMAAEVADVIQLPAFLSRQTDLVVAMAKTRAIINIKKAQFLAPQELKHIAHKFEQAGNDRLILCERGTSFGYNNLVVDMLGFDILKSFNYPVIFDATHALQKPGGLTDSADGRRQQVTSLAKAGLIQKIAGLFIEAHPNPQKAKCDGPCALPLAKLKDFLIQMKSVDTLAKSLPDLDTH